MFKNYKKLYLKEQEQMEYLRQYYRDRNEEHYKIIDNLRDVIKIYEKDYKMAKRLSNIGLWCGIASFVIVTVISILKAVVK
jgi:hypothetical protein